MVAAATLMISMAIAPTTSISLLHRLARNTWVNPLSFDDISVGMIPFIMSVSAFSYIAALSIIIDEH
ncbi:hypothetical protein GCM10007169_08440 [Shewanella fodinae]|nr:hypothetical protein GCM10007169_08440 [Shewanella fodinae]